MPSISVNGNHTNFATNTTNWSSAHYYVGASHIRAVMVGIMPEVIVYNRGVSDTERRQIESYLALKYGVTLDQTTPQDYIASDGATLMWDASVDS